MFPQKSAFINICKNVIWYNIKIERKTNTAKIKLDKTLQYYI